MRLPSIRFFNRVCVCIKGQPCWCKTRTRGDSSSVSTHSLLPRSGTGLIPHKVYIPAHCSFTSTLTNNTGTLPRLSLTYQEAHQKTTPHFRILETQELSHSDHFCLKGGGKSNDKKMAAVGLWRQISLWLWLSCLLLAVYSAPVNEDGPIVEVNDQSDNDNDLGPAIEAIGKAKREARKRSSLRSSNGRTHYRFPNTIKRSMHDGSDDYDTDGEEEFSDSMAAYLAAADDDSTVDLDDLAKEIALNILMEEADKSRENPPASSLKKKKMAPVAHRPRNNSADDKRRKRMNSLMNQLLEERERGEVEESDDYDNQQMAEHSAGPDDNNEANESLVGSEGDQDEEDDSDEVVSSRTELRKLFNDGLERHEINALLSQLDRSRADSEELNKSEKKKKRSGSDWRKLPRASLRWRFLHSQGQESNEPSYGRQQSADDDELQDKNVAFEDRFFGRGFHRVGNIQDEPIRNNPEETAKRVQHPLKTKNAISVIRKRSIATLQNSGEKKPEAGSALQMLRKRRNSEAKAAEENNNKNETAPLALPSAQANNNSNSSPVKRKSDVQVHTGVIRKKSVDWDDYFGYDKRSGKAQGEPNEEAMRNYLESDYYKSMAGSLAFRKRGQMDDQHAGHVVGMKKRNNVTSTSWEKKKKRFRPVEGYNADDAEDVLDAAIRVIEERRERNNIDRVREQLVAELVDNLDENELNQMTERLTEEVAKALYQEEEEEEEDDERDEFKRSSVNQKLKNKKKKKNMSQNDERRKRFAVKRSSRHRSGFNVAESNEEDDDCVIAEQVVSTCNMVSHLYGGYRPVLSDACHRHQACFICSDNEAACDGEFQHRVLALCGPDLLCQSQSRHLLSALGQLDQMEADYLFPMAGQAARIEALCRRDSCLAEFWKRR